MFRMNELSYWQRMWIGNRDEQMMVVNLNRGLYDLTPLQELGLGTGPYCFGLAPSIVNIGGTDILMKKHEGRLPDTKELFDALQLIATNQAKKRYPNTQGYGRDVGMEGLRFFPHPHERRKSAKLLGNAKEPNMHHPITGFEHLHRHSDFSLKNQQGP